MPALVPSVTSADVAACSCTSSFGTDTAGKISARRSEKSRAAKRTRPAGTEVLTTTRIVVTCASFQGRVRKLFDVLPRGSSLLPQPGGFEGFGANRERSGSKSALILGLVGYLNHGWGRDHGHRVQRSRGEQPFTKRLRVL